ncbi:2-C-methyl-D-erythritol 4-phosphate cytidylyltransferase [Paraglaciecola aquimarina]|uniref:2-C-methyl-D-erythritol 4-phosphate cytidylyltransferase n=1 Tax=Paraglaciecola algarum TaxID=3050085 RepID=A0ABS9DEH7_9ALTE|nr:2-C-methyl-D-erythritol 4-phosphate cytidylyltransferase [Paraglaciecola sp. G1-23]MCF2950452.1 2-C-methyl-D-erythritol 4-phosphate cytidylyltransferase [Paraglaciecola sp. G1-23]
MSSKSLYSVVLPAAGIGKRMLSEIPKQYLTIAGRTIIEHTISVLLKHPQIRRVIVVLNPEDAIFNTLPIAQNPKVETTIGGKERADSVLAGLQHLDEQEQWGLVHDAARPCLSLNDISKLIAIAEQGDIGGILASRVRDTMKRSDTSNTILHTESRENLWHALTPQFFNLTELKYALETAKNDKALITDEASAIEYIGKPVKLIEGQASNLKVTQPEDLLLAEFYLTQNKNSHYMEIL